MAVFQLLSYFPENGEGINSYALRCFFFEAKEIIYALGGYFTSKEQKLGELIPSPFSGNTIDS